MFEILNGECLSGAVHPAPPGQEARRLGGVFTRGATWGRLD
jgi:hypothetical protein